MTNVAVENIVVRYGADIAVNDLSLAVPSGEVVAVLGPSGSGKSTLLRVIAGLQAVAGGRVSIGGHDVSAVPTHKRDLGLMFQDHALFNHLNVLANVEYGLKFSSRELSRTERRDRAVGLLDLVGLSSFECRRIDSLSGGEAQRVALARALAPEPGLLMLDEPLGSLDRTLRVQLIEDLGRLLRQVGQTALYVTHDQSEAFALADTIAVMNHGRLLRSGSPAELWAHPGSEFVAKFLGHRNIWTVTRTSDGHVVWGDQQLGEASGRLQDASAGAVRVVVPTVALSIASTTPPEQRHRLETGKGQLTAVVHGGQFDQGVHRLSATIVEGHTAPTTPLRAAQTDGDELQIYLDSRQAVPVGSVISVIVDVDQLSVLEPIQEP